MPWKTVQKRREYEKKNREHINERGRQWKRKHRAHVNKRVRQWRKANPERSKAIVKRYRIANPIRVRFHVVKSQSKKIGRQFELSYEEYLQVTEGSCLYCGQPGPGSSVDRVDSSLGYTQNNVASSCWPCNRMKGDLSVDDFLKHIMKVRNHCTSFLTSKP